MSSLKIEIISKRENKVAQALMHLYISAIKADNADVWINTRDVAEFCNINIYQARYSLLKLERIQAVIQRPKGEQLSLGWRPVSLDV